MHMYMYIYIYIYLYIYIFIYIYVYSTSRNIFYIQMSVNFVFSQKNEKTEKVLCLHKV